MKEKKWLSIESIRLSNFGGTTDRVVEFGKGVTTIKGRNESGKTTIADAYFWCLRNRLMNGNQPDGIRPHGTDGKDVDFVGVVAEVKLNVDGKEFTVKKTQLQEWSKSGAFKGNKNAYLVNDIPKRTEKDFKAFLESEVVPEEVFELCTSASTLLRLDTAKRRQKLFSLIKDVSNADVAAGDEKFEKIVLELETGTIEELIARANHRLNGFNRSDKGLRGKLAEYPARIDEARKGHASVGELKILIKGLKEKLAVKDEEINKANNVRDEYARLNCLLMEAEFAVSEYIKNANSENIKAREEAEKRKYDVERELSFQKRMLRGYELDLPGMESHLVKLRNELAKAKQEYTATKEKQFDDSIITNAENMTFDPEDTKCKYCGSELPTERIAELKEQFEKEKAKTIATHRANKELFEKTKASDLSAIARTGNEINEQIAQEKKDIECIKKQIESAKSKIAELESIVIEVPEEVEADLSADSKYLELVGKIEEFKKNLADIPNNKEKVSELGNERAAIMTEIFKAEAEISASEKSEARIKELEEERRLVAQEVADCERELDLLKEFNRKRCTLLEARINELFKHTKWQLFRMQNNGEYEEICEPSYKGTKFKNRLNDGAKALIEIDICQTFQRVNNVVLPIFVDNAERMTADTINSIGFEGQVILLRAEDCDFTVEEEKEND